MSKATFKPAKGGAGLAFSVLGERYKEKVQTDTEGLWFVLLPSSSVNRDIGPVNHVEVDKKFIFLKVSWL